jgi:hypothetical protein
MRKRTNWGKLLVPEQVEQAPEKVEKLAPWPDW